ncbi:MAG: TetR family transcriptional regulator [Hydrogenophilales bacterium 16-64-46]|nr:MAG: TetR family transcriptional regulator [Hydrogenophilales bacterium 12-64-13]OYZ05897.1 MAG: TetR family transcriptional regulator [Hydrogenophilales bacterium 16-64-46]OZA39833.1 MAG: TetR family transcriptional regulator [Hydrogenophilales bacterium 17-64-34]
MIQSVNATAKSPEQTRQALLQAAFAEIHRKGYQAASLSQILADTGLTKGALYHHFPDKQALGLAVVDEVVRPMLAAMMFEPLANAKAPLAAMKKLLKAKAADPDPRGVTLGCPLNNLMQEMSPVNEDFRLRLNALFNDWVGVVAAALRRGQAAGEVRKGVDVAATAFFIVSALEGCIGMSKNTQSVTAYRACLGQMVRYLDTLKSPAA